LKKTLLLMLAGFAGLCVPGISSSLPVATLTTSLDQCEEQICGSFPPTPSYSGPLSGFPGTLTAGEGTSVTANGFPFPTLTDQLPTSGANVANAAELTYYLEIVPLDGDLTASPVQLGVNGTGSTSVTTVSGFDGNSANAFVELALLSGDSGGAVFSDTASIVYSAGPTDSGGCNTSNTSGATGAGFVSTPGVGGAGISCGSSSMSGGFTESGSYSVSTNSPYEVVMIANLQDIDCSNNGLAEGPGSCQAMASVDPIFSVPTGYELVFSDGVGNGAPSAVPEPGIVGLFWAGMVVLIASKLRKVNRASRACARAL